MSSTLVKNILKLLENDNVESSNSKKQSTHNNDQSQKRKRKRLRRQPKSEELKSSIQQLKFKCVLGEVKHKKNMNLTEDNLQTLQRLSCPEAVGDNALERITEHQRGKLAKDQPVKTVTKKEEKTVFTEEDFRKFEEEYFVAW